MYIMSTMVVVVIELLLSLPIENGCYERNLPCNDDGKSDRMDHTVDRSKDICGNVPDRIQLLMVW